jgi:hypothetical protein
LRRHNFPQTCPKVCLCTMHRRKGILQTQKQRRASRKAFPNQKATNKKKQSERKRYFLCKVCLKKNRFAKMANLLDRSSLGRNPGFPSQSYDLNNFISFCSHPSGFEYFENLLYFRLRKLLFLPLFFCLHNRL